jgi:small GTP-binding protein
MGLKDFLKRIFLKDKKVVICGLDKAGKTTIVSFLKTGTFKDHTPTMGKEKSSIEVQGIRMDLIDLGGQKDFRKLWLGESSDAQCIIFMIDAHDVARFEEAKTELWKLFPIIKKKPLIILANKCDLKPVASIGEIITSLNLGKLPSFEIMPISCKTGFGMVDAFSKIYQKLTGKELAKRFTPKALAIYDHGGKPITTKEGNCSEVDILRGGLFAALTAFAKESFKAELNQLKLEGHTVLFHKTEHLMGSIIMEESESLNLAEAENCLRELLDHLENMCPELNQNRLDHKKIKFLVQDYATNIFVENGSS